MSFDTAFTLELLFLVVLIAAFLGAFLYLVVSNRRTRRDTGRQAGTMGILVGPEPNEPEGAPGTAPTGPRNASFTRGWAWRPPRR